MSSESVNGIDMEWAIGCSLELKTTMDEEVRGTLFTYDRATNCLVLTEPGARPGTLSYRFLKANFIKELSAARKPDGPVENSLSYIDLEECVHREEHAVRALEMQAAPQVHDIETGNQVFSKLSRKWTCKWEGRTIVVEDQIYLDPPYTVDNFRAGEEQEELLEQVKDTLVEADKASNST